VSALREPRALRLQQAYLAHAPRSLVQWTAQTLARAKPVGIEPGWRFDISADDPSTLVQFRRALWTYYRDNGIRQPVTERWYDGLRVRMFLGNDMSLCLYVGASFEPNEFAFLAEVLEAGMTFLDGGSNDGLYSLFASRRVGASGRVLAVEPSAREHERLLENVALNRLSNVVTLRVALGAESGEAPLAIAEDGHEGQNTIGEVVSNPTVTTAGHETVRVTTLDELVADQHLDRLDVVKLDVEGSELDAIRGGRAVLTRFKPILIVEAETERLVSQNATVEDLVHALGELDYDLFVFDAETAQLRPRREHDEPEGNIVAARRGWTPPRLGLAHD
jgi:FkbM family methyltransferase